MRKLVVFIALVSGVACSLNTDTGTGPLIELTGTYSLQTINASPLPFTIVARDTTVLIDTDVLTVGATGDWSEIVNYRQTVGTAAATNESFTLSGFWTRSGNSLNFRTTNSALLYVGTAVADSTLHLSDAGYTYVFKR